MKILNPFFLNTNLCYDKNDILSVEDFEKTVAGNTGNSYISYSLINLLYKKFIRPDEIKNIFTYDYSQTDKDTDYINNNNSHVILVMQDQIRVSESYGYELPFENIIKFLKKIKKPIIITSLGANCFTGDDSSFYKQISPQRVIFFQELASLTESIGVRGDFTVEVLNQLGIFNAEAVGCPSFFETGPDRIISKKPFDDNFSFAVGGSYLNIKNIHEFHRGYVLQDEFEFIEAQYFDTKNLLNNFRDYHGLDIEAFIKGNYRAFSNIKEWQDYLKNFTFLLGSRMHGGIAALNAGIPTVVMNKDSRAREMCELYSIPYRPELLHTEIDVEKLYSECNYDLMNTEYNSLYNNYIKWLLKNHIDLDNYITDTTIESIEQPSLVMNNVDKFSQFCYAKFNYHFYKPSVEEYIENNNIGIKGGIKQLLKAIKNRIMRGESK